MNYITYSDDKVKVGKENVFSSCLDLRRMLPCIYRKTPACKQTCTAPSYVVQGPAAHVLLLPVVLMSLLALTVYDCVSLVHQDTARVKAALTLPTSPIINDEPVSDGCLQVPPALRS